ncbi:ATP-grasp domain-containing protein [Streptacidiphilus sp. PB12-B1b]|uniref:ATP-grasp domain-containing protein n=1 Tax=Streptacidiphilus sp. PB12-B1b TaxID=2705012 RepID=UPI0015FD3E7E|nr:ATP-grasp domain-containing protein [Streptacidiphilus sp. PB12-B1b]QMU78318.1 ATP-grasp domain-containing protein [Streptacidiphilus sp. PB12-B1b]
MHVVMLGLHAEPVQALTSSGHQITVLYEPWERERAGTVLEQVARSHLVETYADLDALLLALEEVGVRPGGVDAVVTLKEFAVVPAALLGAVLGARALDPDVALRCRDKALQKAAWRRAGIPTANWAVVPDVQGHPEAAAEAVRARGMAPPFIVKPLASAGTVGVRAVNDETSLPEAVRDILRERPTTRRLLVEERNEGDEWHFDGLIRHGSVEAVLVSRYLAPLIETKNGHPTATASFPPGAEPELYAEARHFAADALRALGLTDCVFHLEVFGGPGRFVAGELAARPGGGWIQTLVGKVLGIDIWAAAVRAATGEETEIPEPADRAFGYTHLPPMAGCLSRLVPSDIASIPGVVDVLLRIPAGAVMPDMAHSSRVKLGMALVEAEDHETCEAVLREVIDTVVRINGGPHHEKGRS